MWQLLGTTRAAKWKRQDQPVSLLVMRGANLLKHRVADLFALTSRRRLLPNAFLPRSGILVLTALVACFGFFTEAAARRTRHQPLTSQFIITEPSSNSILRGESTFAVSTTDTSVASVEFDFGSKRL